MEAMKINLKEDALTYAVNTARRVPFPISTQEEEELKRLEQAGVINGASSLLSLCSRNRRLAWKLVGVPVLLF